MQPLVAERTQDFDHEILTLLADAATADGAPGWSKRDVSRQSVLNGAENEALLRREVQLSMWGQRPPTGAGDCGLER